MKKKIIDERVETSKLQVYKEIMYIVFAVLLLSLFQKSIINRQGIEMYIDELICLGIIIFYVFIRNLWLGNLTRISETINKKVIFLSTILSSVALTLKFAVNNYLSYSDKYNGVFDGLFWASILLFFIQMFLICGIGFYFIGKKELKQNQLEE